MANAAASKLLQNQLKKIVTEPVEGFTAELKNDANMFEWKIYVEGPKDSPYQGGIFQMVMNFPNDYPMSPPTLKFTSEFWHPNVYPDGKVCISILHPPGHDEMSGELPEERWLPTQTVTTVVLSVMSMLGDPNFSSPANVDASVEWRKQPDAFKRRVKRLVDKSLRELPSHIKIPHPDTDPEERKKQQQRQRALEEEAFELNDDAYADLDDPFDGDEDPLDDEDNGDEDDGPEEEEDDPSNSSAQKAKKAKNAPADLKKPPGSPSPAPAPAQKPADKIDKAAPASAAPPAAKSTSAPAAATAPPSSATLGTPKKDAPSAEKRDKKEKKEKKEKDKKKSSQGGSSTPKKDKKKEAKPEEKKDSKKG